ncbi:MAG: hypothetical protein ACRD0K_01355 [Egibacteraceae bacterium]
MAIVGVHGIWNYGYFRETGSAVGAARAISQDWTNWLRAGLGDNHSEEVRVGYYAHYLHRGIPQGDDDVALLEDDAKDMLVSWVELLQPIPQIAQGPRTVRARQAADWLTAKFGNSARRFAVVFVREVSTYLKNVSPRRVAARESVANTIAEMIDTSLHGTRTVIAHSLGSVVTYEALWAYPELQIDQLITLGSPLGMPGVVFERLQPRPEVGRGKRPPGVGHWVNLADIGDIVAVPRGGLGALFDGITQDVEITIATWGFHKVKHYLSCGALTEYL